jgi:hypothetical protein
LTDYINEGVEDEFIWQELHYWRRVNRRRIEEDEEEWRAQQKAQEKKQGESSMEAKLKVEAQV